MTATEDTTSHVDCPLCLPRERAGDYWIEIAKLSVSTLYLDRNQTYRGQCALAFDARHAEGLERLDDDEYRSLSADLRAAGLAVAAVCRPDLMNYASLGNVIAHVHWHIVPRYRGDPRWGGPIYTTTQEEMPHTSVSQAEYDELVSAIRAWLSEASEGP